MQVFISWSGKRAHQIALGLKDLISHAIPARKEKVFVSSSMDKGIHWFSQIVQELKRSHIGIICLTPESLNSNWLHFEAGALATHLLMSGETIDHRNDQKPVESRLYTYLHQLKPAQLIGPFSAYQATSSTKDDTQQLLKSVIQYLPRPEQEEQGWNNTFDGHWKMFKKTTEEIDVSIQELIPEFETLFHRKTFNEPLQQCRAQKWVDRYHGALETYFKLRNYGQVVRAASQYQIDLFEVLELEVDAYVMSLELLLKKESFPLTVDGIVDIKPEGIIKACESCRLAVKDTVSRILDPLNVPKTDDALRFTRCETFDQKKLLVHRKEYKIRRHIEEQIQNRKPDKGYQALEGLIDPRALEDYLSSPWELDRIYYYLIKENLEEPSKQNLKLALGAVQLEMEKVLALNKKNPSLMPLSYSLGAMQAVIIQPVEEPLKAYIIGSLKEIEDYIMQDPTKRDGGHHIRRAISNISASINIGPTSIVSTNTEAHNVTDLKM